MNSRRAKLQKLREQGAADCRAGKPIDAFRDVPLPRHTEGLRAVYEIGWRAERCEQLERAAKNWKQRHDDLMKEV